MIKWYAASAIFVTRPQDAPQECALVEERVYLVKDDEFGDVWDKASKIAKSEENRELIFEYNGKPSTEHFVGIRKVIAVRSHLGDKTEGTEELSDGSELTFSFFQLQNGEDLQALIDGEMVSVLYNGDPVKSD